ncbi:hypothetical protein AAMO2058_000310400 [Amorphochlora amoebiformis]
MSSSPSARIHALRVGGRAFRRQFRIISVSLVALTCTRWIDGEARLGIDAASIPNLPSHDYVVDGELQFWETHGASREITDSRRKSEMQPTVANNEDFEIDQKTGKIKRKKFRFEDGSTWDDVKHLASTPETSPDQGISKPLPPPEPDKHLNAKGERILDPRILEGKTEVYRDEEFPFRNPIEISNEDAPNIPTKNSTKVREDFANKSKEDNTRKSKNSRRHDESRRRGRRAKKRYSRRDSSRRPHGHRHRSRSRNRPRKPERYRSVLKEFGGVSALGEGRLDERLIRSGENEGRKEKTKVLNQLARL